jgi:hypothetical protein
MSFLSQFFCIKVCVLLYVLFFTMEIKRLHSITKRDNHTPMQIKYL